MRLLVVDSDRCGLDLCLRAIDAGHEVKWFRPSKSPVRDGQGFPGLQVVSDYRDHMKWAKDGVIFVTANNKYITELDRWREFGAPVFGATRASAKLEVLRSAGMEVMRAHDMNIPPYHEFTSLKEALAFAMKAQDCFVFKTMGDEEDKSLSFVPSDPGQLCGWLERKIKSGLTLKGPCMLQEKVPMIAEVGIAAYIGPAGFLEGKWELSWEHKKLCSGEFGPNTGEQGTVIQCVEQSPLADILKRFERHFVALGHTGDVAINGGVDAKGEYWPFEFTMRAGWPDTYIRTAMNQGDPVRWMRDCLDGRDSLKVSRDVFIGVVVAQPPYPFDDGTPDQVEGNPVYGCENVWQDIHPAQMMLASGPTFDGKAVKTAPQMQTTGPYVLVATGHGKTVRKAQKAVYSTIKAIDLANAIVRDDIGEKLEKQLPLLHKLNIATTMDYE